MKIGILSTKPDLYSTRRLQETAQKRNHEVSIINTLRCYMSLGNVHPSIHYMGETLNHYDAIIPRVGISGTSAGTALVRHFEMSQVFCLNSSISILRSRDKFRCLQLLASQDIQLPITGFAHCADDIDDLIKMVGGVPLIIKLIEGTQGIGVVLAETKEAADSVMQAFLGLQVDIMVQEFVEETKGQDIRCFVVGDQVVGSMRRQSCSNDFRSNMHRGGTAELITLSEEEEAIALHATKAVGLNVAGVDLLRSNRGPLVLEVNSSPGLKGIESVTQQDIATMIIEFIEHHYQSSRLNKHYDG